MTTRAGFEFVPDRQTQASRNSTFREYGSRFIRYHKDIYAPMAADEFIKESNRRAARSVIDDFVDLVIGPLAGFFGFYFLYFAALWDDIMFTWDWGPYNEHLVDYYNAKAHQPVRYSKSWDRPPRKQYAWNERPEVMLDHYV